jgi:hypothetical protein
MDSPNTQSKLAGRNRAVMRPAIMLLAAGLLAAGCSSLGGSSSPKASGTTSSGSVPFGDRISGLFGGGSSQSQAAEQAAAAAPTADDIECPTMDIRQGASTLLVNASGDGSDALALRYQGTFVRAARECRVQNGQLSIKIGVQGRLVLGPAGVPGDVTVPVRLALVKETLSDSTPLWTKLYMVPVTISPSLANVEFTTISEDLSMPLPKPGDLEQMTIYIGFDPAGAEMEKRKRPAPKAAKPRRTSAR